MTDDLPDHTSYSLIKATDASGNIVTVLVDSSGRMYAVMKGDYAGSLKTLALDDKGRIQAVLSDPEDVFGNPNYIGAGELAARLGSIKSFEHRGQVVYMDDFEDTTLKWLVGGSGVGHSEARSNTHARSGDYSLKLTTGDAEDNYSQAAYYSYHPPSKKLGVECAFTIGADLKRVQYYVNVYDGTTRYQANLLYFPQDNDLKIYAENGGYVTIDGDLKLVENDYIFHVWKIVFDLDTKKYVRAYIDEKSYDLSAYNLKENASALESRFTLTISIINNAAGNHYIYMDDAIFTQNEP